jgi:DNA-binding beta-propeller fold protein YncE
MKPLAILLLCCVAWNLDAAEPATLKLTTTIPLPEVKGRFDHFALDVKGQRLFVAALGNDTLEIIDVAAGKRIRSISGDTDDLFYDAARRRLYVSCGEGFIDVVQQRGPETVDRVEKIPTSSGARTSFFSPDSNEFYLAVPLRGQQTAEIRIYQVQK